MAISKEQWKEITNHLTYTTFKLLKFKYKDHEIVILKVVSSPTKAKLTIFIDGEQDWGACSPKSEKFNPLCRLFWHHFNQKIYSPKKIQELEKTYGKRQLKKHHPHVYTDRHDFYYPDFKSINSLIGQFKRVDELEFVGEISYKELQKRGSHDQKPTC